MKSLVLELQADCISKDLKPTDLLRKALIIANKLNLHDFVTWIEKELSGYSPKEDIPKYRKIQTTLVSHDPYRGYQPVIIPDEEIESQINNISMFDSISEIENMIKLDNKDGVLTMTLPGVLHHDLQKAIKNPTIPCNFSRFVPIGAVHKIIDTVKTVILQWALNLEKEGILGEGLLFSDLEKKEAMNNHVINIENFQGILGNVQNSSLNQNLSFTIEQKNKAQLERVLLDHKIDSEDVEELLNIIDVDSLLNDKNFFGNRVSAWVGKMTSKAINGTWNIASDIAINVLMKAISQYYGLN